MISFKSTLLSALFLLAGFFVQGQNTCSQTLLKAQIAYYEGRADEVLSILEACLRDGFTEEERSQAYRLLTLTHLYLNESQNAENTMLSFIRLNHYYKINEAVDPAEFINLYKQFRTWPIYMITPKFGTNLMLAKVIKNFSPDNTTQANYRYQTVFGYQTGISIEIPLNARFSVNPEIYLSGKKYIYNNKLFGYEYLSFNEEQNRIELPLLLMYNIGNKRLRPFFQGGFSTDILFHASSQVLREDHSVDDEIRKQVTGPVVNIRSQRKLFSYSAIMGCGIKYRRGKNIFIVDARYNIGLVNMAKPSMRYTQSELLYKYGYIDNDFRLNSYMFSIGYVMPIYHTKKLNQPVER
jgi:hypothetical protein